MFTENILQLHKNAFIFMPRWVHSKKIYNICNNTKYTQIVSVLAFIIIIIYWQDLERQAT